MAPKKIFSVGYDIPGGEATYVALDSKQSLLDADLVVFWPTLGEFHSNEEYQGKYLLTERSSFAFREAAAHWRSELKLAVESGKAVFVFLGEPKSFFVYSERREYSGTGRSRVTTNIVEPASTYELLPLSVRIEPRTGKEIVAAGDLRYLAAYWNSFSKDSAYEATIEGQLSDVLLKTRTGNKVVGGAVRSGNGVTLLLPVLDFDDDDLSYYDTEAKETCWNAKGEKVGRKLAGALVQIAKAISADSDLSPAPTWTEGPEFVLARERELQEAMLGKRREIEKLAQARSKLEASLNDAGSLRFLLYEKGKPLEKAVLEALSLLGFDAQPYRNSESEFDVVFTSPEGRLLGEVEGADHRAINVDKISQLERNLQEDFAREQVAEFAKGVLFGNAYRFQSPAERSFPFTDKCLSAAKRTGVALVHTPDLFHAARQMAEHPSKAYASRCRKVILRTAGALVQFPAISRASSTVEVASPDTAPKPDTQRS